MEKEKIKPVPFRLNIANEKVQTYKKQSQRGSEMEKNQSPIAAKFPITRAILWNRTQIGKEISIQSSKERSIQIYLSEKTLLLAAKHGNSNSGFLVGSFFSESDSVKLQVDRFDPGRNVQIETANGFITRRVPTTLIPGDHVISLKLNKNIVKSDVRSVVDNDTMHQDIKILKSRVSKKHPVNLPDLFISHANCQYQTDINELILDFSCCTITFGTEFGAKPINGIPIIPTALAKNLSGPLRLSQVQGNPKFGYLTMDQTRKLLLLLETDPKVDTLPLVGIWLTGVEDLSSSYTWACCLRFIFAEYIQERVIAPPSSFLLVHYPTTKAYPNFYECSPKSGQINACNTLLACREQLVISTAGQSADDICLEMVELKEGDDDFNVRMSIFDDSVRRSFGQNEEKSFSPTNEVFQNFPTHEDNSRSLKDNDDVSTPRPSPKPYSASSEPHPRTPSVPELSLIEEQVIFSSTKKSYNPKMYQETGKISENRIDRNFSPVLELSPAEIRKTHEETVSNDVKHGNSDLPSGEDDGKGIPENVELMSSIFINKEGIPSSEMRFAQEDERVKPVQEIREQNESAQNGQIASKMVEERNNDHVQNADNCDDRVEKLKNSETFSKIAEHEKQLFELREQIRQLLLLKGKEEVKTANALQGNERSYEDTSIQCSMVSNVPQTVSTGINTGQSLLFNASMPANDMNKCQCCEHCQRVQSIDRNSLTRPSGQRSKFEVSDTPGAGANRHTVNASFAEGSYSLSDLKEADMRCLAENQASDNMQSFASDIQGVDLPVFDDSHNNEPNSPNDITLGASASMIDTNESKQQHSNSPSDDPEDSSVTEKDFYTQFVEEVKGLLHSQKDEEEFEDAAEGDEGDEDFRSCEITETPNGLADEVEFASRNAQHVTIYDAKETDIQKSPEFDDLNQCNEFGIYHPRINYMSMLGADTSDDANMLADEIALKYLTGTQIHNARYNVKQKTVTFEGVLDGPHTPKVSMNFMSVNMSCNMSVATKRYMQKYNLLDKEMRTHPSQSNMKKIAKKQGMLMAEYDDKENEQRNVLDLNKLKGLPKLM